MLDTGEQTPLPRSEAESGVQFFQDAFKQAKEHPLQEKIVQGKFLSGFLEIADDMQKKAYAVDSSLPRGATMPIYAMRDETFKDMKGLGGLRIMDDLVKEQRKRIWNYTIKEIEPKVTFQQLQKGVLSEPPIYYKQEGDRTCGIANFEMIFSAITGRRVDEQVIMQAASNAGVIRDNTPRQYRTQPKQKYEDIEEDLLLSVLQTPAFKEEFPDTQIGIINLVGADFDDISGLISKLRNKAETMDRSFQVFSMATIGGLTDDWHHVILLSADEDKVVVHDPARGPHKEFEKDDFISVWGLTHLRSRLIFAFK